MTAFGDRLNALRKAKGITLRELGSAVKMSQGNVTKILSGRHGATEVPGHRRLRPPTPPLGPDLEMWFDVLGPTEAECRILRMLAAAAHVPHDPTREELERFIIEYGESPRFADKIKREEGTIYQIGQITRLNEV